VPHCPNRIHTGIAGCSACATSDGDELAPPHAHSDLRGSETIRSATPAAKQLLHRNARGARCRFRVMNGRQTKPNFAPKLRPVYPE
jgi:hypothetical protein